MELRVEELQRSGSGWEFELIRDWGAVEERERFRTDGVSIVARRYRDETLPGTLDVSGKGEDDVRKAILVYFENSP